MYTILATCPPYGSRNVGDQLIELRLRAILARQKHDDEAIIIFREEPLDPRLDEINASRAVLMPGFPIRDTPMYPLTYRLADDLDRIQVPLIPVGANWNVYPGDEHSRRQVRYSQATAAFLRRVAAQVPRVSCRERFVCDVLGRHGIHNTLMTGDPAMFCLQARGRPMHRPGRVGRLVFTPPLSPFYAQQAEDVLGMLAELYPEAVRFCAFHLADAGQSQPGPSENSAAMSPEVAAKNRRVRLRAEALGYRILPLAGNPAGLATYDGCDLHVGYECHAHVYFLSVRRPSVLIAEDARGVGFNGTIGVGGFDGFLRRSASDAGASKGHTSGYCTTAEELAVAAPREDLTDALRTFLRRQSAEAFADYAPVAGWLDDLYASVMAPFMRSLP